MATQAKSQSGKSGASKSAASKSPTTKSTTTKTTAKSAAAKKPAAAKPASKASAARKPAARRAPPKGTEAVKRFDGRSVNQPTAIAFLMNQHREAEAMFEKFEKARSDEEKAELSRRICMALKVHTQIEEELVYPEAHDKIEEDVVDEAYVEHASAKDLIAQIERMQVGEHLYDAKVKVLGEYVKHHVKEEETEFFPQLKKSDMDLQALGERLKARAEELQAQLERGEEPAAGRSGFLGGLFRGSEART
jgi:hypothetical protein